jgi:hypothetical protein
MSQNAKRVAAAVGVVQQFVPFFRIFPKTKSKLHRAIGWLLGLVGGKAYTTSFFTTLGYTAAWPSCYDVDWDSASWACILHEGQHAVDASRLTRPLFGFLYAIPQALAAFALLGLIWGPWWLLLIALALLGPLPALFRLWAESRAYGLESAIFWWWRQDADFLVSTQNDAINYLTGSSYYFAWPWRQKVTSSVGGVVTRLIHDGQLTPYEQACKALAEKFRAEDWPVV